MIENKRFERAKTCDSCLEWHDICDAECCKTILLDIDPGSLEKFGKIVSIKQKNISPSSRWYFRLHDVEVVRDILRFKIERISILNGKLVYLYPCAMLDENNLCKGHPDNKPEMCRDLKLENIGKPNQLFRVTDNCLLKYTRRNQNGKA